MNQKSRVALPEMKSRAANGIRMAVLCFLFGLCEAWAQGGLMFEAGMSEYAGVEMPYRVARTASDGVRKPALVVYLHGGSSKGSDNEKQMQEAGIDSIVGYLVARRINAVCVVPQCPADRSWAGPMLGVLKAMIDSFKDAAAIDADRIYIFGGSMGGTGTWSMLSAYPHLFAAAMPVAGNPSKCDAANVASTPVFTVMGTADRIMSVETAAAFVEKLKAHDGDVRFETEDGWTHEMTCIQSYTAERLDWVFAHELTLSGVEHAEAEVPVAREVQYYSMDGRRLAGRPQRGLYVEKTSLGNGSVKARKLLR